MKPERALDRDAARGDAAGTRYSIYRRRRAKRARRWF